MKEICDLTMDDDGFFEGVYDRMPDYGMADAEQLARYMPFRPGWALDDARPELFGFKGAIDDHVPALSFPYNTTNTLVQVGMQYWADHEYRTPVPEGYSVLYVRAGRSPVGGADQTKSLTVDVLRANVAAELAEEDPADEYTRRRWQRVARVGQPAGNAVLACSLDTHSYLSFVGRVTTEKHGELKPVTDRKLAEAVFDTIRYWQL